MVELPLGGGGAAAPVVGGYIAWGWRAGDREPVAAVARVADDVGDEVVAVVLAGLLHGLEAEAGRVAGVEVPACGGDRTPRHTVLAVLLTELLHVAPGRRLGQADVCDGELERLLPDRGLRFGRVGGVVGLLGELDADGVPGWFAGVGAALRDQHAPEPVERSRADVPGRVDRARPRLAGLHAGLVRVLGAVGGCVRPGLVPRRGIPGPCAEVGHGALDRFRERRLR